MSEIGVQTEIVRMDRCEGWNSDVDDCVSNLTILKKDSCLGTKAIDYSAVVILYV